MKKAVLYIVLTILIGPVSGQDQALLGQHQLLGQSQKAERGITEHIRSLKRKRLKLEDDVSMVDLVFQKTQARYFRTYKQYAQLEELVESGTYNCLSGTILYALIFQALGYKVGMYETRYHAFLILDVNDSSVLIESTDRVNGIVKGEAQINIRIRNYLDKEEKQTEESSAVPLDNYRPIRSVTFKQLVGLLYLNKAVVNINNGRFKPAIADLLQAKTLYPESERILDLLNVTSSQWDMYHFIGTAISTNDQNPR